MPLFSNISPNVSPRLILNSFGENSLKSNPYLISGFSISISFISTGLRIFSSFLQPRIAIIKKRFNILKIEFFI